MSVPEQVPYKEYLATGSNNSFEITFYLPDPKDLVVMVNKEIPLVGAYSVQGNTVVFNTAPNEGDLVELTRDTQLDRETEYKSYDNSFRPETINFDLDKIWLVLQESNLVDAKILARLKQEIEWRRTHDFNYDELAQVREKQLFDALKGYSETLLASTNPGVFQGVIAGVVFAQDGKSVQTHLKEIADKFAEERQYLEEQLNTKAEASDVYPKSQTYTQMEVNNLVDPKADQTYVDEAIGAISTDANKQYATLAAANADIVNIPVGQVVFISEATNGGYWYKELVGSTSLTKSAFDPVAQSKIQTQSLLKKINNDSPVGEYSEEVVSQATISGYLNSSGSLGGGADPNWKTSDFIKLSGAQNIAVKIVAVSALRSVCFYNADKVFISASPAVSTSTPTNYVATLNPPAGAKYIRFTKATSSLPETTLEQINAQSIVINGVGEAYIDKIAEDVDVLKAGNLPLETNLLSLMTNSGYINTTGSVVADTNFKNTDFIPAKQGDVVKIKLIAHTVVSSIAFYDANKTLLTKVSGASANQILTAELTAPANTAYVRISGATVVGSITLPDPYAKKLSVINVASEIENLKDGAGNKQEYQLLAPSAVYTTCNDVGSATNKGRLRNYSTSIYLDHMLNGLTSEKHIRFKDAVDKFTFVAPMVVTDSNENTPAVTLNNGVNANEATTAITVQGNDIVAATVNVKHRSALNSVTASAFPKVLCIGDSITYGEMATLPDDNFTQNHAYHLIAKELFMKDKIDNGNSGFDCLFLGTKSRSKTASYAGNTLTVNTKHEGVRGRSLAQHLDGTDATFWDSVNSKFSINAWLSKYRTMDDSGNRLTLGSGTGSLINSGNLNTIDVCKPTHVLIALGMNNGGSLAQFQSMISSIRTELPNAIIGIAITDAAGTYFPSLHPNCSKECTIWNDTGAQGSRKNQQYNLLKTLQDYYGTSYENQNIYMVPFYHTAPTAESVAFRKADQLDAEYSSILESDFRQHYGWHASTHTNALGHINWGYQLYSWIKWTIAKSA